MYRNLLKILRLKYKWSEQRIADLLGVSKSGYDVYELGKRPLSPYILENLCYLYGLSADYFCQHYELSPEPLSTPDRILKKTLWLDDPSAIRRLIAYAKTLLGEEVNPSRPTDRILADIPPESDQENDCV
ncbi:MAG: helix-turn-helix domain-containing protein [Christensenellaceae bacterium]